MTTERKDDDIEMKDEFVDNAAYDEAVSIEDTNPTKAMTLYASVINESDPANRLLKLKEDSVVKLATLYAKHNKRTELQGLLGTLKPLFSVLPKSRTAKIVRSVIDTVIASNELATTTVAAPASVTGAKPTSIQVAICLDAIQWCQTEKRTFLKQRIQARLSSLYVKLKQYTDALPLIAKLIKEVKKFDDKLLLVEIFLIESRAQLALQNIPKSKGALTAARSNANSIYCPPTLQAEIDLQAGILCSIEGDYKTAFSYFYESFEGYSNLKDTPLAVKSLKYMLLSKIMNNQYEDVYSTINGKAGIKYAGIEIEAMRAITDAYKARSIEKFQKVYQQYDAQLAQDSLIASHLKELQEKLLEQNLIRLIEPFTRVEIAHVAKLIKLSQEAVESKLSQMILDKKLNGILDQGTGVLILFPEVEKDTSYRNANSTVKELNHVVDRLYTRAKHLTRV